MDVSVTPIYAAIIALLMAALSTATAMKRGKTRIALGNGGNAALALAIRRFGNLSEYAAMAVLILLLMEIRGVTNHWLHTYGTTLILLRLLHPFILFDKTTAPLWQKAGRFIAGAGTAALLFTGAIVLLVGLI